MYKHIKVPANGQKITLNSDFSINVPDQPIVPYIEGDGTGMDITPVMLKVVDAAVAKDIYRPGPGAGRSDRARFGLDAQGTAGQPGR